MCLMQENEIDYLLRYIDVMFFNMDKIKFVKSYISKVKEYNEWVDVYCRLRYYSFQIRKCDDIECCFLLQANRNWLFDLVFDVNGNYYKSFESIYGVVEIIEDDRFILIKKLEEVGLVNRKKD